VYETDVVKPLLTLMKQGVLVVFSRSTGRGASGGWRGGVQLVFGVEVGVEGVRLAGVGGEGGFGLGGEGCVIGLAAGWGGHGARSAERHRGVGGEVGGSTEEEAILGRQCQRVQSSRMSKN
jgi:hypothetical protein